MDAGSFLLNATPEEKIALQRKIDKKINNLLKDSKYREKATDELLKGIKEAIAEEAAKFARINGDDQDKAYSLVHTALTFPGIAKKGIKHIAKMVDGDDLVKGVGKKAINIEGLSYELKHLNKHLMGTKESIKLINKEGSAHLFTDIATLSKAESTILKKGNYLGNVRGWERYGYKFENPIGYRIGADGSKVPLHYGEMKIKNGLYHIIPRTGPSK
jgi:hypothetical protein